MTLFDIDEWEIRRIKSIYDNIEQELKESKFIDTIRSWGPVDMEFLMHFHSKLSKKQCPQCKEDFREK